VVLALEDRLRKSRREREKEALREKRRSEIMDAAMSLFDQKGIQNVTMEMIAEKVELTRAAIYLYFDSRDDLLFSLLCEMSPRIWSLDEVPEVISNYELLKLIISSAKVLFDRNRIIKHIVMNFDQLYTESYPENLESARRWRAQNSEGLDTLTAIVNGCIEEGHVRSDIDARATASLLGNVLSIFGGTASVRRRLLIRDHDVDPYVEYCNLLDYFMQAISVQPTT
jgi:AcrR family transcriptional regulator